MSFNPRKVTASQVTSSFCKFHKDSLDITTDTDLEHCEDVLLPHVKNLVDVWFEKHMKLVEPQPQQTIKTTPSAADEQVL